MSWIRKIAAFIAALFSGTTAQAILNGIRRAAPYVSEALELATLGASICGGAAGRTVATVVQFATRLGVPALLVPNATDAQLGTAMRDIVVAALKLKFPEADTASLNRAVEIAVGALRP